MSAAWPVHITSRRWADSGSCGGWLHLGAERHGL